MSNNTPRPYLQMRTIAESVLTKLAPACHRIEIAGSLRRKKAQVRDIEIVAIPIMDSDLFGNPVATSAVDHLLATWPITLIKNGQKYKQFKFTGTGGGEYTIDLFLQPDPLTWPVNFLLRTGSAEFSHKMVTPKAFGGYKPDGYEVRDARVWRAGVALELKEEEEIFEHWGMEYVLPENRV